MILALDRDGCKMLVPFAKLIAYLLSLALLLSFAVRLASGLFRLCEFSVKGSWDFMAEAALLIYLEGAQPQ